MKKFLITIVALLAISLPMFAGGSSETNETKTDSALKIALVCSGAGQNDNGYNQSAVEGLKAFADKNQVEYKVVEPSNGVPAALEALADDGYNLIFSLEYDFEALINGVGGSKAIADMYPNTTFVIFNDNPNVDANNQVIHDNVISVLFDVHEGSFLAGVLSVEVIENQDKLFGADYNLTSLEDGGRVVGFIGGTNSNGITVFSNGYIAGVNYEAAKYNQTYDYYSKYDAGFGDPATGATVAGTFFSNGANVVYGCAGVVGDGIDAKAKELGKLSIQVDADKDSQQPGHILTSVLKNTNVPVSVISQAALDGTISSMENLQSYSMASGAAGITDLSVIGSKIEDQATWTKVLKAVDDAKEKVTSGAIKVTNAQGGDVFNSADYPNVKIK
ncbi:MAG: BMP family lipoprotein [Sphaerochaeta sp.]